MFQDNKYRIDWIKKNGHCEKIGLDRIDHKIVDCFSTCIHACGNINIMGDHNMIQQSFWSRQSNLSSFLLSVEFLILNCAFLVVHFCLCINTKEMDFLAVQIREFSVTTYAVQQNQGAKTLECICVQGWQTNCLVILFSKKSADEHQIPSSKTCLISGDFFV